LPARYKNLSSILLPMLIPFAEEVIGDHQCEFLRNRSTNDHKFYLRQIFEKNVNTMKQLLIDFKKAYD
jgi:hypothetical protein